MIAIRSGAAWNEAAEAAAQAVAAGEELVARERGRRQLALDPLDAGLRHRTGERPQIGAVQEVGALVQLEAALLAGQSRLDSAHCAGAKLWNPI